MASSEPKEQRPSVVNGQTRQDAGWEEKAPRDDRWQALLAILAAILLYVTLPSRLYFGQVWILPAIEAALFLALLTARRVEDEGYEWQRGIGITLTAVMTAANIGSLGLLVHQLLYSGKLHGHEITAVNLFQWSAQIWLTNVIVFGLWYWEMDRGGPLARSFSQHRTPDFQFPQMANPDFAPRGWAPVFFDYLYTSYTNAAAFSPTDTMPLSEWSKALFMVQSLASLSLAVLVVARIANILP